MKEGYYSVLACWDELFPSGCHMPKARGLGNCKQNKSAGRYFYYYDQRERETERRERLKLEDLGEEKLHKAFTFK
jgi:hypothetical protein